MNVRGNGMGIRHLGSTLAAVMVWIAVGSPAAAQQPWKPEGTIEIVVPSGPGGGTDKLGRLIQRIWQEKRTITVPVSVVNKQGGGGAVALTYLAQHRGDAHYVEAVSAVLLTNDIAGRSKFSYTDFTPLALLNSEYVAIAVKNDSPMGSLKELMARLKQEPESVSIAVGTSLGGANHIAAAAVARAAGGDSKKLKPVVFKSSAESAVALLGGHVDIVASSASLLLPHVLSGAVRILGISAPRRLEGLLGIVPTFKDQGVDAVVDNFRLMIAPNGLTQAQITYWDDVLGKLARDELWIKDLKKNLWENTYMNSRNTKDYLDRQYSQLKSELREAGLVKTR